MFKICCASFAATILLTISPIYSKTAPRNSIVNEEELDALNNGYFKIFKGGNGHESDYDNVEFSYRRPNSKERRNYYNRENNNIYRLFNLYGHHEKDHYYYKDKQIQENVIQSHQYSSKPQDLKDNRKDNYNKFKTYSNNNPHYRDSYILYEDGLKSDYGRSQKFNDVIGKYLSRTVENRRPYEYPKEYNYETYFNDRNYEGQQAGRQYFQPYKYIGNNNYDKDNVEQRKRYKSQQYRYAQNYQNSEDGEDYKNNLKTYNNFNRRFQDPYPYYDERLTNYYGNYQQNRYFLETNRPRLNEYRGQFKDKYNKNYQFDKDYYIQNNFSFFNDVFVKNGKLYLRNKNVSCCMTNGRIQEYENDFINKGNLQNGAAVNGMGPYNMGTGIRNGWMGGMGKNNMGMGMNGMGQNNMGMGMNVISQNNMGMGVNGIYQNNMGNNMRTNGMNSKKMNGKGANGMSGGNGMKINVMGMGNNSMGMNGIGMSLGLNMGQIGDSGNSTRGNSSSNPQNIKIINYYNFGSGNPVPSTDDQIDENNKEKNSNVDIILPKLIALIQTMN